MRLCTSGRPSPPGTNSHTINPRKQQALHIHAHTHTIHPSASDRPSTHHQSASNRPYTHTHAPSTRQRATGPPHQVQRAQQDGRHGQKAVHPVPAGAVRPRGAHALEAALADAVEALALAHLAGLGVVCRPRGNDVRVEGSGSFGTALDPSGRRLQAEGR